MAVPLSSFPLSSKDYTSMAVLGYTSTQKLLYDYGDTETFYVYVTGGAIGGDFNSDFSADFSTGITGSVNNPLLFSVSSSYASQWFGLNGSNGLVIVYNPFFRAVA